MAGALLVKEAMKRVKKKGCTRFTAHIQENNVSFFKKTLAGNPWTLWKIMLIAPISSWRRTWGRCLKIFNW
jgi:hypothetical protein